MREKLAKHQVIAQLFEDRGAAASSAEFFRCPEFLAAEGVTHSLVVESDAGRLAVPLLVRDIPGSRLSDAISPYGYPGGELQADPPDPFGIDWSETGLVSIFMRDRVDSPSLGGGTERSTLQIADPELPRKSRMSDRQQVRKNQQRGYAVRWVPGPDTTEDQRRAFGTAYEQTMRRTQAGERYFFPDEYFDSVLSSERSLLFLCEAPGGAAAASIAVLSDGFIHYYLSGTADEYLSDAPMKSLLTEMIGFAEDQRAPLNLGGGITPGDGLEEFKRGFANRQVPFVTHELVCDRAEYERLTAGRATDFFPAYRAME